MSECELNPYPLPKITFVGGETQDLAFNTYFRRSKRPFSLSKCTARFAVVNYMDKHGEPILSKPMQSGWDETGSSDNVLLVTLSPEETMGLEGKYIYQISIKDVDGIAEIPKHGILVVLHNIDKSFLTE